MGASVKFLVNKISKNIETVRNLVVTTKFRT